MFCRTFSGSDPLRTVYKYGESPLSVYNLSFKDQIDGRIAILMSDAGMSNCSATREGLAGVVDSVSRYQEEGQKLYPKFILTENIQRVKLLLPQSELINIGVGPISTETYHSCLKQCAPLATDEWYIIVERSIAEIRYGLIRSGKSSLSALPEQIITEQKNDPVDTPILVIRQVTEGTVEIVSANGHELYITFAGKYVSDSDRRPKLTRIYQKISEQVAPEVKPQFVQLLDRIFSMVVERGHGTLAIVVEADSSNFKYQTIEELKDGNWLPDPIDLTNRVQTEMHFEDQESGTATRCIINVVAGMLMSDGITVFDTTGRVLGYRVFARPMMPAQTVQTTSSTGGARRRAFNLLSSLVGRSIVACMMVSQDGGTLYKETGTQNEQC